MLIETTQLIGALALGLFIPGYLIVKLAFNELELLEQIALSVAFSIMVDVIIAIFLGYNETMKNITGGVNTTNAWIYLLGITAVLGIGLLVKKRVIKK